MDARALAPMHCNAMLYVSIVLHCNALTQFEYLVNLPFESHFEVYLKVKGGGCFSWKPAPVLSQPAPCSNPPLHNTLHCIALHCTALYCTAHLHNNQRRTPHCTLHCTTHCTQYAELVQPCRINWETMQRYTK